jgi:hypothetical protein
VHLPGRDVSLRCGHAQIGRQSLRDGAAVVCLFAVVLPRSTELNARTIAESELRSLKSLSRAPPRAATTMLQRRYGGTRSAAHPHSPCLLCLAGQYPSVPLSTVPRRPVPCSTPYFSLDLLEQRARGCCE